jgi:RNA polymerase sigma factor (sigma-70 family)
MGEKEFLAERFEANRGHLRSVAYRMLGSLGEAEDAVQEAWLRLAGADTPSVKNLRGWLTTVVARICLDQLRARKVRHEEPIGAEAEAVESTHDAEREAEIADSIGIAMLVVLETLPPAERVAFVLHDMFALPFDDIASVVGRSPAAARQLASRARRRVQGQPVTPEIEANRARQREVIDAFLAAARGDDFTALLAVLDPDVVLRADAAAVKASAARASSGAPPLAAEVRGVAAVANIFKVGASAAQSALISGDAGLAWVPAGRPVAVFDFVIENDRIVEISVITERQGLAALTVEIEPSST